MKAWVFRQPAGSPPRQVESLAQGYHRGRHVLFGDQAGAGRNRSADGEDVDSSRSERLEENSCNTRILAKMRAEDTDVFHCANTKYIPFISAK